MEIQQLTCPQLLSDEALRGVLKDRCIEVQEIEKMDKIKLIEIFKRVALPLPQRKYSDRELGKRLQGLRLQRKVRVADYEEITDFSTTATESSPADKLCPGDSKQNGRLKPPIGDADSTARKIRLFSTGQSNGGPRENDAKRKNDVPLKTDAKKRQKITWP